MFNKNPLFMFSRTNFKTSNHLALNDRFHSGDIIINGLGKQGTPGEQHSVVSLKPFLSGAYANTVLAKV